jgi:hypothetical protein
MDHRFTMQEQFLREDFVDPIRATVNRLADQMGRMVTCDQKDQFRVEFAAHTQAYGWFRHSVEALHNHFYTFCPRPSASSVIR